MKIELHNIPVRDMIAGYKDSAEEGVVAYGGKLDIRPKYQREFVYTGKQRDAVIETINQAFPLNVMYWMVKEDGNWELVEPKRGVWIDNNRINYIEFFNRENLGES